MILKMKNFFHNKLKKTAVATLLRQGFLLILFWEKDPFLKSFGSYAAV